MLPDDVLRAIYADTRTIAVVGASSDPFKPSHSIAAYLQNEGFHIIPVSPKGGVVLGEEVAVSLAEIHQPVEVVDVFRPAAEAPAIARQAVEIGAKVLWLQGGIVSDEAAEIASSAGLQVVMDACMRSTHQRLFGPG